MPATPKQLFRGAATTSVSTTLYTTPASTTTVVSSIAITNTAATSATYTLSLGGTLFADAVSINGDSTVFIDTKQVLTATQTIQGGASATTVNIHIAGVELV